MRLRALLPALLAMAVPAAAETDLYFPKGVSTSAEHAERAVEQRAARAQMHAFHAFRFRDMQPASGDYAFPLTVPELYSNHNQA